MSIRRFDTSKWETYEGENGDYVLYKDYALEVKALREQNSILAAALNHATEKSRTHQAEVERLSSELEEAQERNYEFSAEISMSLEPLGRGYLDQPDGGGMDMVEFIRRAVADLLRLKEKETLITAEMERLTNTERVLLDRIEAGRVRNERLTGELEDARARLGLLLNWADASIDSAHGTLSAKAVLDVTNAALAPHEVTELCERDAAEDYSNLEAMEGDDG